MSRDEKTVREAVRLISLKLSEEGKIIEAGWQSLRLIAIPDNASPTQVSEMRKSFFAGAQHLWASIMTILDPNAEPTAKDMQRMDLINNELAAFVEGMKQQGYK